MLADPLDLVTIPGGPFLMGTPDAERSRLAKRYGGTRESYAEESPQHAPVLGSYAIGRVPVTNALYAEFVVATGTRPPVTWRAGSFPSDQALHPVTDVRWDEAQALCRWLQKQTGLPFRLPTEAEWEKAARGTDGRPFPWGDNWDASNANTREAGPGTTTPVGSYPDGASPFGVLDMAGNTWEWTQSLQAPYPYADDSRNAPPVAASSRLGWLVRFRAAPAPPSEQRRILRGGCYANPEGFARCACRLRLLPTTSTPFLGIRLALTPVGT